MVTPMKNDNEKLLAKIRKDRHLQQVGELLDSVYLNIDARRISLDERQRLSIKDDVFVYGEIIYPTFALMLKLAEPKPGEVFYDLGSGSGKAVLLTSMLYDLSKAVGVEYLAPLYELSTKKLNLLTVHPDFARLSKKRFNVQFYNQDLFEFNIEDADIIYMNATCFIGDNWTNAVSKFTTLKRGTRIILTTKSLPEDSYKRIFSELMPMSWGTCTLGVYEKIV